jgi:hypothetical protein
MKQAATFRDTGDSPVISSGTIPEFVNKAAADYENPDDVWKEHAKKRLVQD